MSRNRMRAGLLSLLAVAFATPVPAQGVAIPNFWDPRARQERPDLSGLRTVRFLYCDHGNIIRGKTAHAAGLSESLESGIGLTVAMQAFTLTEHLASGTRLGPVGEIRLVPGSRTFAAASPPFGISSSIAGVSPGMGMGWVW